jgi:26S proteasome regulatory subunit T6
MSLQRGINLRALAEKMGQCSGAEVRGICTEAGSSLFFIDSLRLLSIIQACTHFGSEDSTLHRRTLSSPSQRSVRSCFTLLFDDVTSSQVMKKNQDSNTSVNKLFS